MSNLASDTDTLSRTTVYEYDDFNRLVRVSYPSATTGEAPLFQTLAYDAVGTLRSGPTLPAERQISLTTQIIAAFKLAICDLELAW